MADKNPIIIIQARLGSARLPGKVLKEAGGRPLLAWLLSRLAHTGLPMVLAVPRTEQGEFASLAAEFPIQIFGGDNEDVLGRYTEAARANQADPIIRVTGDNPLTSVTCLKLCLERFVLMGADLCHPVGLPYGAGVEVVGRQALEAAWKGATLPEDREHVTPWIYKNPGRFEIIPMDVPEDHRAPDLRVTVDTPEDFARFEAVALGVKPRRYIRLTDVISFFKKKNLDPTTPSPEPKAPAARTIPLPHPVSPSPPAPEKKSEAQAATPLPQALPVSVKPSSPEPVETLVHPEGANLHEGGFSAVRRAAAAFLANLGKGEAPVEKPAPAPQVAAETEPEAPLPPKKRAPKPPGPKPGPKVNPGPRAPKKPKKSQ